MVCKQLFLSFEVIHGVVDQFIENLGQNALFLCSADSQREFKREFSAIFAHTAEFHCCADHMRLSAGIHALDTVYMSISVSLGNDLR